MVFHPRELLRLSRPSHLLRDLTLRAQESATWNADSDELDPSKNVDLTGLAFFAPAMPCPGLTRLLLLCFYSARRLRRNLLVRACSAFAPYPLAPPDLSCFLLLPPPSPSSLFILPRLSSYFLRLLVRSRRYERTFAINGGVKETLDLEYGVRLKVER